MYIKVTFNASTYGGWWGSVCAVWSIAESWNLLMFGKLTIDFCQSRIVMLRQAGIILNRLCTVQLLCTDSTDGGLYDVFPSRDTQFPTQRWHPWQQSSQSTDQSERPLQWSNTWGWTLAPWPSLQNQRHCHYLQQLHPALWGKGTSAVIPSYEKRHFHCRDFWQRSCKHDCKRDFSWRCCSCWVAGGGHALQHPEGVCQRGRGHHARDVVSECVLWKKDGRPVHLRVQRQIIYLQIYRPLDSEGTVCVNATCLMLKLYSFVIWLMSLFDLIFKLIMQLPQVCVQII